MRIVSLVPSATEILFSLGAGDEVVGVTYACDYPPEARTRPIVVSPRVNTHGLQSREIDRIISELYARGETPYMINRRLLSELRPDVVVAQGLCEVCAVTPGSIEEAIKGVWPIPKIIALHPHSIEDVFTDILRVGEAVGRIEEARKLVAQLREEVRRIAEKTTGLERKRTFFMEWVDPPYCSGHWVPEMVEIAGGFDLGVKGKPSRRVTPEEVLKFSPEVIICGPCGYSLQESYRDATLLMGEDWVRETPAFIDGEVYAVNSSIYFSRHTPSTIKGISILAEIIHPAKFRGAAPPNTYVRCR
ncbi:Vitamin B12-binding protein [Candidatus Calditenuaceae archaeon HR02]|nr:Vitamin B12-binding protein [Candidatus Calditenuaceae archaeon HR02]